MALRRFGADCFAKGVATTVEPPEWRRRSTIEITRLAPLTDAQDENPFLVELPEGTHVRDSVGGVIYDAQSVS